MIIEAPTSALGYHVRCACRANLVWLDCTDGTPPGPDFCSQGCQDDWHDRESRKVPMWATE
jgi:hypothetical protein